MTTSCRRKWLCPTCGYAASWREAAKRGRRLCEWTARGGAVALLTLTQSHCHNDDLAELWSRMQAGWEALTRGSGWTADKQAYGVRGYVRITEVVHNPATGWNVHFHVIVLLDGQLGQPRRDGLRASLAARFARGVENSGGHAAVNRQDLQPMTPGTEAKLANYCFKGTTMRWSKDGSRTPMAILSDLESTGEGVSLWQEFTAAVSTDRRMQVIPSTRIDSLCPRPRHYSW
ncbi:MAG: protein rep [Ktedonobacterales bacterium]